MAGLTNRLVGSEELTWIQENVVHLCEGWPYVRKGIMTLEALRTCVVRMEIRFCAFLCAPLLEAESTHLERIGWRTQWSTMKNDVEDTAHHDQSQPFSSPNQHAFNPTASCKRSACHIMKSCQPSCEPNAATRFENQLALGPGLIALIASNFHLHRAVSQQF